MTIPPTDNRPPALVEPARLLLDQIADKWTIEIMAQLCGGPLRFNALKRQVPGITQKALTHALRRLERNGLVGRRVTPSAPPAVEYRNTELGFSLALPIKTLLAWTATHLPDVERAQEHYDRGRVGE